MRRLAQHAHPDSHHPNAKFWPRPHNFLVKVKGDKKCRFWCLSKPGSGFGPFGPHLGVIRWGGVLVGVMCPFCTISEKHPHIGTHEKQGQRLAYTLPLDTVDL